MISQRHRLILELARYQGISIQRRAQGQRHDNKQQGDQASHDVFFMYVRDYLAKESAKPPGYYTAQITGAESAGS